MALAGAGGGRFLYALVKEESHKEKFSKAFGRHLSTLTLVIMILITF
jgi:hypothetical protein